MFRILHNAADSLYIGRYVSVEAFFTYILVIPEYRFFQAMAKCFCITSGCRDQGGQDVDVRTLKKHSIKDKIQSAQKASEAANRAVEEEVNAIASHLASQTLADNVSGLPCTQGGRLWSKCAAEELPESIDITATYSPSRRELLRNLLSKLGRFDSLTKALHEKVTLELQTSDSPYFLNSPTFPLNHLHLERLRLEAEIEIIKSKAASVRMLKESIKQQLLVISDTLRSAKKKWKIYQESSYSMAPPTGLTHSTGTSSIQL
jgi:hypothetical protein